MKDVIKKIIKEYQDIEINTINRDFQMPDSKQIITLIGLRRVGKSYILFQTINQLKKTVDRENIVYLNFDDERLELSKEKLDLIIEAYFELYPEKINEEIYLFFDEIQNVPGWELFIKRLYETKRYKLFITGSSSKLLSKELSTELRGRSISFHIFPLSFREFLRFKNKEPEKNYEYTSKRYDIKKEFKEFTDNGGFPEVIFEKMKIEILRSYIDLIVYKDVIERYKIKNLSLLKDMIRYITTNISKEFSVNSYFKAVYINIRTNRETIAEYFSYLEDVGFVYFMNIYNDSLKKQMVNPKKIYCIDTGIANAISFKTSKDSGRILENLVFIELKRNGREVYYHKGKNECDFIIKERLKITQAIQVAFTLHNSETRKRELAGLIEAMKAHNLKKGLILTEDEEEEITEGGLKIKVMPVWKWLLER